MGLLISAVKAMQKYGIREQQIVDIMDWTRIAIYGPSGKKLDEKAISDMRYAEYEKACKIFCNNFLNETGRPPTEKEEKIAIRDAAHEHAGIQAIRKFSFNSNEFEAAIEKTYPDITTPKAAVESRDEREPLHQQSLLTFISVIPNMITAPLPPHDPKKVEIGRMKLTQQACQVLIEAIEQGHHLDEQKVIDKEVFLNLVKETMAAHGMVKDYHVTTAKYIYDKSPNLRQFKRRRGHKKSR